MVVLDDLRDIHISVDQIHSAMRTVDELVTAATDAEAPDLRLTNGFTGGNLHRIRARGLRDEVLREVLAA